MSNGELKPCPFCGGEVYTYQCTTRRDGVRFKTWLAHCKKCHINYPPSIKGMCLTEAEAIAAWNERVGNDNKEILTPKEMAEITLNQDELLKYRAIGTVDQCRKAMDIVKTMIERDMEPVDMEVLEAYINFENELVDRNFTVKSLLEARKKAEVKPLEEKVHPCWPHIGKMFFCQCGAAYFERGAKWCGNCGQKLEE